MTDINFYFQQISNPFLDSFFLLISNLTNEYLYVAIVAFVYFFINKRKGLKLGFVICSNMMLNCFLKNIFAVDRPYVTDKRLKNKDAETGYGYSFPSGHSQFNAGFFSALHSCFAINKYLFLTVGFVLMVAFSRVWLGVHTVLDVCVGVSLGWIWGFFICRLLEKILGKKDYLLVVFAGIGLIDFLVFRGDDTLKMLLLYLGFTFGYLIETRYIKYEMPEKFKSRVAGFIICVLGIIIIQAGFSFVDNFYVRSIKYLLTGFWATGAAPAIMSRKVILWKK